MWDNVINALKSIDLWSAVFKSISIILIGFFLSKAKILPETTNKVLTKIVLIISLPCLAFTSFMKDITSESFKSALFAFGYGFFVYTILIILVKMIFAKVGEKRKVLEILVVFGSTTFFGQPLINAVFPEALSDSNMFNISYRVFLYSYAYIVISGVKLEKGNIKNNLKNIFLNPIIIATFLGFILWALQLVIKTTPFYRIDKTVVPLFDTMKSLGNLSSPLVWIAIGCTLSKISIKEASKNKMVWTYSFIKVLFIPIVNLVLLYLLSFIIDIDFNIVASSTLMFATPPATVAVSYCINYDKEAIFASNCSLISTIVSVLFIPFWIIVLTIIGGLI